MRLFPKKLPVLLLLVGGGCTDLIGVGDLSSTTHAGSPSGETSAGQTAQAGRSNTSGAGDVAGHGGTTVISTAANAGFAGSSTRSAGGNTPSSTSGTAGFAGSSMQGGGTSQNTGGDQTVGGDSTLGNAGWGGNSTHFGGAPIQGGSRGAGGTQAIGGDSTLGNAGWGGSPIQIIGSNDFGTTAGVAGFAGSVTPGNAGSAGNSTQGGESMSGDAGFGGDLPDGGTAGASGQTAGGAPLSGGFVTVFDLVDYLLDLSTDLSTGVWRLRSMQRYPLARNLPLETLILLNDLPAREVADGLRGWGVIQPAVVTNLSETPFATSTVILPPRSVTASPGENGEYADIAWIAPAAGLAYINAEFLGIDLNGTTTDVHILVRGERIWSDSIDGTLDRAEGSPPPVPVQPGDTIEFAVGLGRDNQHRFDSTDVRVVILFTSL